MNADRRAMHVALTPLFKKLNLGIHREIAVFDAPDSFESELKRLRGVQITRNPSNPRSLKFGLAFAITQAQLDRVSKILASAAEGDAVLWIAYPKGTSKRYSCEFNRDSGWSVLHAAGFDTVRQVAIDDDWSALRFRRTRYVKSTGSPEFRQNPEMASTTITARRAKQVLDRLTKICLSLPEAQKRDRNEHADFRVRDKVFAYFLNDHHGDHIVSVCCKSDLGENVDRASREPERFYLPAYIGPRGWFGLRLDGDAIDWEEVRNLVEMSYALVAPKSLLKKTGERRK